MRVFYDCGCTQLMITDGEEPDGEWTEVVHSFDEAPGLLTLVRRTAPELMLGYTSGASKDE